jgi:hypothetical protein
LVFILCLLLSFCRLVWLQVFVAQDPFWKSTIISCPFIQVLYGGRYSDIACPEVESSFACGAQLASFDVVLY